MATEPARPATQATKQEQERTATASNSIFSAPPLRSKLSHQTELDLKESSGVPTELSVTPAPPQGKLTPADATTAAAAALAVPAPSTARPTPVTPVRPAGPPAGPPVTSPALAPPRPPAPVAALRRRHWLLITSFLLFVLLPSALWGWYLWSRAEDQYTSTVGFSVRREEGAAPIDMFGGIFGGTASSTASDTDILYEFIRSPDIVEQADNKLNIRKLFSVHWPRDFIFAFNPNSTIEDLTKYWQRQVKVYYDDSTGIINIRVAAFSPEDAKSIADTIFVTSEKVVNGLSEKARQDATRQAEYELEKARIELTEARQAMTAFRVRTRIVDPTVDLGAQMQVMTTLQGQLADAQVALDTLRQNARPKDQRVIQAEMRVTALETQINAERNKFGGEGSVESENYALLMGDYERLKVDLEFAEGAHQTARIAYQSALMTAQRQSRYLAAHIMPALAQRSTEPSRPWLLMLGSGLAFMVWSIMILIYYSVRDRR